MRLSQGKVDVSPIVSVNTLRRSKSMSTTLRITMRALVWRRRMSRVGGRFLPRRDAEDDVVEQWLEQVMICAINDRDLRRCSPRRARWEQVCEAGPDD